MANTLGALNPLRYRGYVYDNETGLYYLQSRYYDPSMGRFISADVFTSTGQGTLGSNMFAYCGNNPVNRSDPDGYRYLMYADVCGITSEEKTLLNQLKSFLTNLIAFESSISATKEINSGYIIPPFAPVSVSYSVQHTTMFTDVNTPLTVYGNYDSLDPLTSSAGFHLNYFNHTIDYNYSFQDIGAYHSTTVRNYSGTIGVKIVPENLSIGIQFSYSVYDWDSQHYVTNSIYVSTNAFWIIAVCTGNIFFASPSVAYNNS